jgi:hypothetical protein
LTTFSLGLQAFPQEEMQVVMLRKFLQLVGMSCRHRHLSHPFAAVSVVPSHSRDWDPLSDDGGHYVVCLDCGKKFPYDWSAMRLVKPL